MKKHILLTIILVSGAATLFAQPGAINSSKQHMPGSCQQVHTAAKTTASIAERPIASVTYMSNGSYFYITDSTTYSFSGTRGNGTIALIMMITGGRVQYNADTILMYNYDTLTSAYSYSSRYIQTFDANNNCTSIINQNWTGSSWSNPNQQDLFTYDGSNNMLTHLNQNWNTGTSSWINNYQESFTYDGMHNMLTNLQQTWNTGTSSWDNSSKQTNTYYALHITGLNQVWNSGTSSWDNYSNDTNTYDAMNNWISESNQSWNTATGSWVNTYNYTNTYDGMNDRTSTVSQNWDTVSGTWVNIGKNLFSSFVAKQPQLQINQRWDKLTSAFVNRYEYHNTYDSYNMLTYEYSQTWDTTSALWHYTTNDYAFRYYYQEYATSIQNISKTGDNSLVVYPNPNNGQFTIEPSVVSGQSSVEVFNVLGEQVYNTPLKQAKEHTIDLRAQPGGVYLYRVISEKGELIEDGKVIIRH